MEQDLRPTTTTDPHQLPAGELVKQLSEQTRELVAQELALAKLELTKKATRAGIGGGMFGAAGILAVYAVGALTACLILALSLAVAGWLAALIVAVVYAAVAGVLALERQASGPGSRATPPVPEETVDSVKEDVRSVDEATRQGSEAVGTRAGDEPTGPSCGATSPLPGRTSGSGRRARREDRRQGPGQEQGAERQAERAAQEAGRRGARRRRGRARAGPAALPPRPEGLRPVATTIQQAPEGPTDLKARSWRGVLSRTVREFKEDNLTVWAAALTYYGILAIFPAIIALVRSLGFIGPSATQPLLDNVRRSRPARPRTSSRAPSRTCRTTAARPGSCSSSASRWRCGRPRATWRRSCRRRTPSTTSRRDARSGRRSPSACGRHALSSCCWPSAPWPSCSPARWPSRPVT